MDWSSLITLIVGSILGGQWVRFTQRGRLTDHIDRRLTIWERLPPGETKDDLQRLIESDVRYLVAHDDRPTTKERLDVRWAFAWVTMAVLLVALTFVDPIADGVRVPLRIVAFLAFLIGLSVIMRIRGSRSDRRWARLADAERAGIQPSSKPARDSQKLQPRTGKM
jgi:hypothetical protein